MLREERRAIFEKFNQLHDHLTGKPAGVGIGLAISRLIVARLGGLIWCEESEAGGAAFVVLLPAEGRADLIDGLAREDRAPVASR